MALERVRMPVDASEEIPGGVGRQVSSDPWTPFHRAYPKRPVTMSATPIDSTCPAMVRQSPRHFGRLKTTIAPPTRKTPVQIIFSLFVIENRLSICPSVTRFLLKDTAESILPIESPRHVESRLSTRVRHRIGRKRSEAR